MHVTTYCGWNVAGNFTLLILLELQFYIMWCYSGQMFIYWILKYEKVKRNLDLIGKDRGHVIIVSNMCAWETKALA